MAKQTQANVIPQSELAQRRAELLKNLNRSAAMIFAGEHDPHSDFPFRPHRHFEYLTGVIDEPGAVLLLDPSNPVVARREMLFLKPLNPEVEKWDGFRLEIADHLRTRTGFKTVFRTDKLAMFLLDAARRSKSLRCLHPLSQHTSAISPDLEVFQKLASRVPGLSIQDGADDVPGMRCVKSSAELRMIQQAADITAEGFAAMYSAMRPGINEFDIERALVQAYQASGSRHVAFPPIVGSGINSTVLHYRANDKTIEDGELVCVDSGAKWQGYSADVTRTVPANGTFSKRQRQVYEVVLNAQLAAIKAVKPGVRISQIDGAARKVINDTRLGDYFIHGIGHHLGLDTHDPAPAGDQPLKVGAVITIEPGVYIPKEEIGIRIEDDVLVTQRGFKVLTSAIPKTVNEIEAAMKRKSKTKGKGRR